MNIYLLSLDIEVMHSCPREAPFQPPPALPHSTLKSVKVFVAPFASCVRQFNLFDALKQKY